MGVVGRGIVGRAIRLDPQVGDQLGILPHDAGQAGSHHMVQCGGNHIIDSTHHIFNTMQWRMECNGMATLRWIRSSGTDGQTGLDIAC